MIAIIDYDAGNLKSVQKALDFLHQECVITRDFHEIRQADKVILPGVGSFGEAMTQLKKYELDKVIQEVAEEKKPFLGICLGLQLLFEGSEESSGVEGLHLLDGQILRIPDTEELKIPHIGWNSLDLWNNGRLFGRRAFFRRYVDAEKRGKHETADQKRNSQNIRQKKHFQIYLRQQQQNPDESQIPEQVLFSQPPKGQQRKQRRKRAVNQRTAQIFALKLLVTGGKFHFARGFVGLDQPVKRIGRGCRHKFGKPARHVGNKKSGNKAVHSVNHNFLPSIKTLSSESLAAKG